MATTSTSEPAADDTAATGTPNRRARGNLRRCKSFGGASMAQMWLTDRAFCDDKNVPLLAVERRYSGYGADPVACQTGSSAKLLAPKKPDRPKRRPRAKSLNADQMGGIAAQFRKGGKKKATAAALTAAPPPIAIIVVDHEKKQDDDNDKLDDPPLPPPTTTTTPTTTTVKPVPAFRRNERIVAAHGPTDRAGVDMSLTENKTKAVSAITKQKMTVVTYTVSPHTTKMDATDDGSDRKSRPLSIKERAAAYQAACK